MKPGILFIVFFPLFALSDGALSSEDINEEWKMFKLKYGKSYANNEEHNLRKSIWQNTVDFINRHNQEADMGKFSYKLGMNQYGDWKQCGSCWAFSAIAGLEGQHFRKTKKLVSLSEQNLIDCSKENKGCSGGSPPKAYDYIKDNHGIDTEVSYPYTEKESETCGFVKDKVGATCTGFVNIPIFNETSLQVAVASIGPISACIDSSHRTFIMYKSGVYDEPHCNPIIMTHCILVAGYGVFNGKEYWLVKNSWGTTWGMKGYIMMSRNKDLMHKNTCRIKSYMGQVRQKATEPRNTTLGENAIIGHPTGHSE